MTLGIAALPGDPRPIIKARTQTEQVREDLCVAGAELHLANTALGRKLAPGDRREPDVRKALEQSEAVEDKVAGATEELAEVKELLDEEVAERHRLERELARRSSS